MTSATIASKLNDLHREVVHEVRAGHGRPAVFRSFLSRHSSSRRRRPIAVWTVVCERVPLPDRTDVLSAHSPTGTIAIAAVRRKAGKDAQNSPHCSRVARDHVSFLRA